jgi:hypothetical protein
MNVMIILALTVAVPVILFPALFVWFLNVGGVWEAMKQYARERKRARSKDGNSL